MLKMVRWLGKCESVVGSQTTAQEWTPRVTEGCLQPPCQVSQERFVLCIVSHSDEV